MMANIYEYEVYGLEPVKVVKIIANSKKHAESKLEDLFDSPRKLDGWKYLSEEELDESSVF
jgi:hypothetical protein